MKLGVRKVIQSPDECCEFLIDVIKAHAHRHDKEAALAVYTKIRIAKERAKIIISREFYD